MLVNNDGQLKGNQLQLKNRYDRSELAGAFGDLGTIIPFIIGYLSIVKMETLGVLFTFGIFLIASGLYYKTPIPVQPMKAIGAAAVVGGATVTPEIIWGAGIFTGIFWLIAGLTGKLHYISKFASKPVLRGIMLGLGLKFIIDGITMMQTSFLIAAFALLVTFVLLKNKKIPAMFVLLLFGLVVGIILDPKIIGDLKAVRFDFQLPKYSLGQMSLSDFVTGAVLLGITQVPLTLGNAVIGITQENNRLFPHRPVTENKIAISKGIMNLLSPILGGIPVCHGAGGMAGHVRFGARTGGSLVILGVGFIIAALFFSSSILLLLNIFPESILGVILFFAGLELSVSARDVGPDKNAFYILIVTAGFSIWNIGIGLIAGLIMQQLMKKEIIKV